jgi:hypothetical protein
MSPFLLLVFPGLYLMWRRASQQRGIVVLIGLIIAAFIGYNGASVMWWGGFTVGPRYLVPMLPFMALPIIFAFNAILPHLWGRLLSAAMIAFAVFSVGALTIAGQTWPPVETWPITIHEMNSSYPLFDYSLPLLAQGDVARNYGGILLNLPGLAAVLPLLIAVIVLLLALPYLPGLKRRPSESPPSLEQVKEISR